MQEQIANLVHPVFNHGLRVRERLDRGESPDLDTEQAALKGLLLSDLEARRWPDFGGDNLDGRSLSSSRISDPTRRSADTFLGIRYALVCWLDELFIDSPWGRTWNEQKLETQLYGTNIRAELFWEQARRAEARPGSDALEVYFLCVMLGFRGELRDQPERLQAWVGTAQTRIARSQGKELTLPPEHEPLTFVPPRHGLERLQRMVLVATVTMLALIIASSATLMYYFLTP
jgi:type VI secretion system protein ImpK